MFCFAIKKVNFLKYFSLSGLAFLVSLFFCWEHFWVIFGLFLAILLNQLLLIQSIQFILQTTQKKRKAGKTFFLLVLKTAVLVIGFYWGVHFMGDKIIIPIILYIIQLAILGISLKR